MIKRFNYQTDNILQEKQRNVFNKYINDFNITVWFCNVYYSKNGNWNTLYLDAMINDRIHKISYSEMLKHYRKGE